MTHWYFPYLQSWKQGNRKARGKIWSRLGQSQIQDTGQRNQMPHPSTHQVLDSRKDNKWLHKKHSLDYKVQLCRDRVSFKMLTVLFSRCIYMFVTEYNTDLAAANSHYLIYLWHIFTDLLSISWTAGFSFLNVINSLRLYNIDVTASTQRKISARQL